MIARRDRHGHAVDVPDERAVVRKDAHPERIRDRARARGVAVGDADQHRVRQRRVLLRVEAPEVADPDNRRT